MVKYKYLLFDFDGCLYHSLPLWFSVCNDNLCKRKIYLDGHEVIRHIIPDLKEASGYGVTDVETFIYDIVDEVTQKFNSPCLHKNVVETLCKLEALGTSRAIVTSTHREAITKALLYHNIDHHFDVVLTRNDVTQTKPNPEVVLKALEKLSANPECAMIIGDSEVDVRAGKAAGIKTCVFYPPENEQFYEYEKVKSFKSDFILRDFAELPQVISI